MKSILVHDGMKTASSLIQLPNKLNKIIVPHDPSVTIINYCKHSKSTNRDV